MRHRSALAVLSVAALLLSSAAMPAAAVARGTAVQPAASPQGTQAQPAALQTVAPAPASPVPSGLIIPPVPLVQPGYRAPAAPAPSAEIVGVTQEPFVGIALQDAISMALAKNTDLSVSQSNRRIAGYQIVAAQGAYDVRFAVQPSYNFQKQAPLSPFQAGPGGGAISQSVLGANGSLSGQLGSGGNYTIGFSGQGFRSDNTADGFNPYFQSALSFSLTQPLLKGRYSDARHRLDLARINADSVTDQTLLTASQTMSNVEDTYWDLVAAWRNVAIQEEGLRQVKAQSNSNGRLVKQGAAAPVDVVEADTQVDVYQDNVLSALQNVATLQNQLKALTLADPADPIWMANLVPTSAALDLPAPPGLNDVILAALKGRPEVSQITDQRRALDSNLAYAKDQAKPQVDLNVGYTSNGFAGDPSSLLANPLFSVFTPVFSSVEQLIAYANKNGGHIPPLNIAFPTTPAVYNGGFGTSINNLLANRLPEVAVSATIGFPLANRTARANLAVVREQEQQLQYQQAALIQRLVFESRNAVQSLQAATSRLNAARAGREASERVYASEMRKFNAGTSTTFLVLQRQTDLVSQRGRELQAQTDLNKAEVEIDRVSGAIFVRNGFNVGTAATAPPPQTSLPARASPPPVPVISPLP